MHMNTGIFYAGKTVILTLKTYKYLSCIILVVCKFVLEGPGLLCYRTCLYFLPVCTLFPYCCSNHDSAGSGWQLPYITVI